MSKCAYYAFVLLYLLSPVDSGAQWAHRLSLDSVVGLHNTDTIYSDQQIVFRIRITSAGSPDSGAVTTMYHRFRVYSPVGTEWQTAGGRFTDALTDQMFHAKIVLNEGVTGRAEDTVWYLAGGGFVWCGGLPDVFDEVGLELVIGPIDSAYVDGTICIDSVGESLPPYSTDWTWHLGWCDWVEMEIVPDWDGPHCFTVARNPCLDIVMGDADHNGVINAADLIMMINVLFKGAYYDCILYLDANCSCVTTAADVIYAVNYIFKSGPAPCNECDNYCFDLVDPPCLEPPQP